MEKFRSPFSSNELWLTQTYHTGGGNTAVDFSATTDTPVYAIASGVVTYRSAGSGSYCIQTVKDSDIKIYYVHTYKWVNANTFVNKGDIICYIAPTSLNGGYPTHLHLGLQIGKWLMDYFDRSIIFRTKYQAIKDIWFKGEVLDWSKFSDLSYMNSFKIGDRIVFNEVQNIREGSGTSFKITGQTGISQLGTIKDGVRVADGYNWFDIQFYGGGTGWVADVGKFTVLDTIPVPPTQPPSTPNCDEYIEKVRILSEEIEVLNIGLGELNNKLKLSNERENYLSSTLKRREAEYDELKLTSENEVKRLQEDLDLKNKTLEETVSELNGLKEKIDSGIFNIAEMLYNLFNKK